VIREDIHLEELVTVLPNSYCSRHHKATEEESDKERSEIRPGERSVDSSFEV